MAKRAFQLLLQYSRNVKGHGKVRYRTNIFDSGYTPLGLAAEVKPESPI